MASAAPCVSALRHRYLPARLCRHVCLVCLCASLLLFPVALVVATWGLPIGRTVHLTADGKTAAFLSFQETVGGVLAARKIAVHPGDLVAPVPATALWPGVQITVVRAVPFTLTVAGRSEAVRAPVATVGAALRRLDVSVGPIDKVYPDPATALAPGMRVSVERRAWRTWVEYAPIPFRSEVVNDNRRFKGNNVLRSAGRAGQRERMVRVLYANGRPAAMEPAPWIVAKAPVPRVFAIGTRAMIASRGEFAGREYMLLDATAYYPGPDNYGGGVGPRTAIGMVAQRGVVAVDPSLIPLGTRLYIEDYGYAVAGDTGGAIHGRRIDLCYNTYGEAMRFGRRQVKVYILGKP